MTADSSAGGPTVLRLNTGLTRNTGATVEFAGVGADLGAATNSRVTIAGGTNPVASGSGTNLVIPWATVTGPAGYDLATAPYAIGRFTDYATDVNATAVTSPIVRLNGVSQTLTAARTVGALLLENGATVAGSGANTLTVGNAAPAGLVVARGAGNAITTTAATGSSSPAARPCSSSSPGRRSPSPARSPAPPRCGRSGPATWSSPATTAPSPAPSR